MSNLEVLKLKLETLKAKYNIIKDKLLLFGAGFGGSIAYIKSSNLLLVNIGVEIFAGLCFSGILINLYKAGKIQKELEKIKEGLTNA